MNNKEIDSLINNLNDQNLKKFAGRHLDSEKQKQLKEILSDKSKIDSIMQSKEAQDLMKKLRGKQNGKHQ